MKKVLQHGYDKFATTCKKCGCYFAYELSDVDYGHYVKCPECSYDNRHGICDIATDTVTPGFWKELVSDTWTVKDYPIK
jgi:hypothetical protein